MVSESPESQPNYEIDWLPAGVTLKVIARAINAAIYDDQFKNLQPYILSDVLKGLWEKRRVDPLAFEKWRLDLYLRVSGCEDKIAALKEKLEELKTLKETKKQPGKRRRIIITLTQTIVNHVDEYDGDEKRTRYRIVKYAATVTTGYISEFIHDQNRECPWDPHELPDRGEAPLPEFQMPSREQLLAVFPDGRFRRILEGLLEGRTEEAIANELGISQSAVSKAKTKIVEKLRREFRVDPNQ